MLKEIVEVVDSNSAGITIKFSKQVMCVSCQMKQVCHAHKEIMRISSNGFVLQKGDKIEIGIFKKKVLLAGFIIFFVPILIFVASLLYFHHLSPEINSLTAFCFMLVYYFGVKLFLKRRGSFFQIEILRKI